MSQRALEYGRVQRALLGGHVVEVLRFAAHVALRVEVIHGVCFNVVLLGTSPPDPLSKREGASEMRWRQSPLSFGEGPGVRFC
ncbi:hypothetical protein GCM10027511_28030 [Hymenobacter humi]